MPARKDRRRLRESLGTLAERAGLDVEQAREFIVAIVTALQADREVWIKGLGLFYPDATSPRRMRTPVCPEDSADVGPRRFVRFRQAVVMRKLLNQDADPHRALRAVGGRPKKSKDAKV